MENKKKENYSILFIFLLCLFIAFIPLMVKGIINFECFNISDYHNLGDAIGGLSNPIIGIGGITVTFLAFYIQYQFNREQSKLIAQQRQEITREQFDNKFYKLLEIHNRNVESIYIKTQNGRISGRESFKKIVGELHIAIALIKKNDSNFYKQEEYIDQFILKDEIKNAYNLVFNGALNELKTDRNRYYAQMIRLNEVSKVGKQKFEDELKTYGVYTFDYKLIDTDILFLEGHSSHLSVYFRFLFMFVKFIDDLDEKIINYKEKRNYLKILRSQMSNEEQMLLFYNWLSGYGEDWLNDKNKFLTDYRILHNVYTHHLFEGIVLNEIFKEYKKDMRNLHEKDYLFDEESWDQE